MKKINRLVICKEDYHSETEWKQAISDAVMLLLNAGYIMTVDYDEKALGNVLIEYEYSNQEWGCAYPYWLLPEEIEKI